MKKCLLRAPVLSLSGYGVHSRQILYALSQKFDVASQAIRWGETAFIFENSTEKQFALNSVIKTGHWQQVNMRPDVCVHVTVPPEFTPVAPFNIGITAGIETDRCKPEWIEKLNQMNLIIVPAQFVKQTFEASVFQVEQTKSILKVTTPIEVIPESVDTMTYNNIKTEDVDIDFGTTFNFITVGQWGVGAADRKNIVNLIKVFKETFANHKDKEKIGLILRTNSVNGTLIDNDYTISRIKEICKEYDEFPKIHLIHGHMPDEKLARLYKDSRVKVFISLTHGEGYGLPLLEAAACDIPVMATNWSGHLDFLNLGKFVKLPYNMADVPFENDLFMKGSKWADVDLSEVKRHMTKIYDNYSVPKAWAVDLGKKIRENLNIAAVEKKYFEVFEKYGLLKDDEEKKDVADAIFGDNDLENEIVKND